MEEFGVTPIYNSDIPSLDFNEFSLLDINDPALPAICSKWHCPIFRHLQRHYGVEDMVVMQPWLILRCAQRPNIVSQREQRPFTIYGCIAVWLGEDDSLPPISPGAMGWAIDWDDNIQVDESLADDLQPYGMPKLETLFALKKNYFPDASAICFISCSIIVEYEVMENAVWFEKLETVSANFKNINIALSFTNGLLASAESNDANNRVLAPSSRIHQTDTFYMDTPVTGRQMLVCAGVRVEWGKGHDEGNDLSAKNNVARHQIVFAKSEPKIFESAEFRTGALLVRAKRNSMKKEGCLDNDQICRVIPPMEYSDQAKCYCVADPVDLLMEHEKCARVSNAFCPLLDHSLAIISAAEMTHCTCTCTYLGVYQTVFETSKSLLL